jgi:hypothetical protein
VVLLRWCDRQRDSLAGTLPSTRRDLGVGDET